MNIQQKLSRLAEIDGFVGAALFTPGGRLLAKCEPVDINLELVGTLANNVLRTAEKASLDMGFGHSHFIFFHTKKALVLLRCLNEGKNPLGPDPGKCHIHLVLLVDNPNSLGIAKLEIKTVVESLAEDFRTPKIQSVKNEKIEKETNQNIHVEEKQNSVKTAEQPFNDEQHTERKHRNIRDVVKVLDNEHIDKAFDDLLV